MAAVGRAALFGVLISISASAAAFAQSSPAKPGTQTEAARPQGKATVSRAKPTTTGQSSANAKPTKPGETMALDDNQRSLIDRVSLYLSTISTLVGDFVQV